MSFLTDVMTFDPEDDLMISMSPKHVVNRPDMVEWLQEHGDDFASVLREIDANDPYQVVYFRFRDLTTAVEFRLRFG